MKTLSKQGNLKRWVADVAYASTPKSKRAKKLRAEADRHDKDAMQRKKNQRHHLNSIR